MGNVSFARIGLVGVAALALAWPSAAAGSGRDTHAKGATTITGKLQGAGAWAGAPAEHIVGVRAVQAETGRTVAFERLTGSLGYKLKVSPGFYMVVAEVADLAAGQQLEDHSHLIKLKKGQRKRASLRVEAAGKRAATAAPPAPRSAAASRTPATRRRTNKVIAVSPDIRVQGTGHPGGTPITDMLIHGLVNGKCPPEANTDLTVVVHRRSKDWQFLQDEIRLQNSGAVDPSTRVRPNFIRPQIEVVGGGQMSDGVVSMQVSAVKIRGGDVVATASVSGPEDSFFDLTDQLAAELVEQLCGEESALFDATSASGTYNWNFDETETFFGGSCTVNSSMQWDTTFAGGGAPFELFVYEKDRQGRPIYAFNSTTGEGVPVTNSGNGVSTRSCSNPDPGPNGSAVCDIRQSIPNAVTISAAPDESTASTTKMHWNYAYPQFTFSEAARFGGGCTQSGPRPPSPPSHVSGGLFVNPLNDPEGGSYTDAVGVTDVPTSTFNGDTLTFTFSGSGSFSFSDEDGQGSSAAQWSMTVNLTRR